MESIRMMFILAIVMALFMMLSATTKSENVENTTQYNSIRGASRFVAPKWGESTMKCNKFPRICRAKGSPGPDCCHSKCVNVYTDRYNCGMCGKKCKYSEMCCKGKCVNPWNDKNNCGRCNNKCKKGNSCVYGMCNYA